MTDAYLTVSSPSSEELLINKSRFIGYAAPCGDEPAALAFLQGLRDQHKTATHHCYAYIIGQNSGIMRYSDDGEPGGTAGLPIMSVLRGRGVVNCCVVVVRYFGGVLLGTGGLVRAYTQAAQAALAAAGVARMERTLSFPAEVPYSVWDKFRYAADRLPVLLEPPEYGAGVSFSLRCRFGDAEEMLSRLQDAAERKLTVLDAEESWYPWKIDSQ